MTADLLADTTDVRAGYELDQGRLEAYLQANVDGYGGPLTLRQFKGGQSSPTYLLVTPQRRYVLRRKPPGQLQPSAHAVDREYRVISALGTHTQVPVARAYALCTDDSVIGTWFYVMEHVSGRVFWDASFPDVERERRPQYCYAMVEALASLHTVNPAAVGLADYGKPGNYCQRQIARWSKQYQQDATLGRMPSFELLTDWLQANIPASEESSLVHGDYRCDNVIFDPREPRVLAILDWELSTIGNPIADFGYHLMMYRMPTMAVTGIGDRDLAALNIPTEAQYVAEYCRRTGRRGIPEMEFYLIFNFFRLAAVFHGIRIRMLRGTAASVRAREYAEQAEPVAEIGWRLAQRATAAAKA